MIHILMPLFPSQGDTSVGKTSLITYLAQLTGNKCVRVNNHEHTDIQEYLGSYTSDVQGKLVFKLGVLAEAMHQYAFCNRSLSSRLPLWMPIELAIHVVILARY